MLGKRKNNYERTIQELKTKRRNNQVAGITFAILTLLYMGVASYLYFTTGLVGYTVLLCTVVVISFIAAFDSGLIISEINLIIYLKEHEK